MNNKFSFLLLLSCAYFHAPHSVAADSEPIKPKLISMKSAGKSNYGITIIKGKITKADVPNKKEPVIAPPKNEAKTNETAKKNNSAKIISNHSCANKNDANHNKNLADSLKAYLAAKNQDITIIDDILFASKKTNVNFELLIVKAMIESDLGRLTEAKNSSARGVFQYIDQTWLTLLKRYGDKIKEDIEFDNNLPQEELLNLRYNARIASLIKSYQTLDDEKAVKALKNKGIITATDHYIAHMMGLPLAKEFYALINNESNIILAKSGNSHFKRAAKLNPAFFNDHNGNALGAQDAYQKFHDKISARYDKIQSIQKKYGNASLSANGCDLPSVKTARL